MKPEEKKEILETYKWIKVKAYKMNEDITWEQRYHELEKHHLAETNFLIQQVRDLVNQLPET